MDPQFPIQTALPQLPDPLQVPLNNADVTNGQAGLNAYQLAVLGALGQASDLPAPNFSVFVPQEDGTVIYVAPPAPSAQPESVTAP